MKKRWFYLPLLATLFLTSCQSEEPEDTSSTEPTISQSTATITSTKYKANFEQVRSLFTSKKYSLTSSCYYYNTSFTYYYDYDDSIFLNSSYELNPQAAEFLIASACCAYKRSKIKGLLEYNDYSKVIQYWYDEDPNDSLYWKATEEDYSRCEFTIAKRKASIDNNNFTIYGVAIRGTNGLEWIGNFDMGNPFVDGNKEVEDYFHKDFYTSAHDYILPYVKEYIENDEDYNPETSKLWVTGQSRGAAAANVLGGLLADEDFIKDENTFVYTYGTPNVKIFNKEDHEKCRALYPARPEKYKNIYNFNNPGDLISQIPLTNWGFERFGTDIFYDLNNEKLYADLKACFKGILFQTYTGETEVTAYVAQLINFAPTFYDVVGAENAPANILKKAALIIGGNAPNDALNELKEELNDSKMTSLITSIGAYFLSGGLVSAHVPESYYILTMLMFEGNYEEN